MTLGRSDKESSQAKDLEKLDGKTFTPSHANHLLFKVLQVLYGSFYYTGLVYCIMTAKYLKVMYVREIFFSRFGARFRANVGTISARLGTLSPYLPCAARSQYQVA